MIGQGILNSDWLLQRLFSHNKLGNDLSIKKHNQAICDKLPDIWGGGGGEKQRELSINNNKPSFQRYPIEVSCSLFRILSES